MNGMDPMRLFNKTLIVSAAFLALMVIQPGAEVGSLVVIAATNAGKIVPGRMMEPGDIIEIPAGGKVTWINERGGMIQLGGPYSGPVVRKVVESDTGGGGLKSALTKIAKLVTKDKKQSTVLGASRKTDPADTSGQPDPWLMSVDSSGHRCVRIEGVQMWRKRSDMKASVNLRSQSAKQTGLIWKAGENRMPLPKPFVKDGTLIVMKIGQDPRRINLHVAPGDLDLNRPGYVLNWMIDNKCTRQAEVWINRLHESGK